MRGRRARPPAARRSRPARRLALAIAEVSRASAWVTPVCAAVTWSRAARYCDSAVASVARCASSCCCAKSPLRTNAATRAMSEFARSSCARALGTCACATRSCAHGLVDARRGRPRFAVRPVALVIRAGVAHLRVGGRDAARPLRGLRELLLRGKRDVLLRRPALARAGLRPLPEPAGSANARRCRRAGSARRPCGRLGWCRPRWWQPAP